MDLKLFTKIIAERLTHHLQKLINQVGFLQGREARDGIIRRPIDIIYKIKKEKKEICLLSTDTEKAFDRVNWQFMFQTLDEVGIGNKMKN